MTMIVPRCRWIVCSLVFVASVSRAWAGACDSVVLPAEIKTVLERDFSGWQVVTPEQLSSADDRQIWQEAHGNECPGIIAGHFRGRQVEYALNLVRGTDKRLEQQIVFFGVSRQGFKTLVLDPPSHVAVVTVLRIFPPGVYESAETGKSMKIKFDTIGISEIEGGAMALYWDGKRLRRIVTSL